ncbi:hypothetical protein [Shewanella sp. NIFS-20-20]|uniref:hypothetical protein n=1 Tax=Shewanella sp. NIFS-20-20 TaxID=2853806 RepID=UPI001C44630F|nr:hypothetical protein [Shewanella sp. NIFS-20-20]MBV7314201.1 hypothetical protein [Shewanella sp. NIFS-20-20]
MLKFVCLLLTGLLTACVSEPPKLYSRINEAYNFEVSHCDSFALVTGVSRQADNLRQAQDSAKGQAEELGGTHIVWLQTDMGDPTRVVAVVYKCLQ